jgi:aquaporin Z
MNKFLMEFIGTLFFIYIILAVRNPLAIGAALALMILIGKSISGGNFNPVVSVVMAAYGKLPMQDLLPYVISQLAGGFAALELYKQMRY